MQVTFFEEPADTREEILAATYRALCANGYDQLTLATIGEELDKATSLVYYHYDSKDELLLDCLDAMIDQLERAVSEDPDDPRASIETLLELCDPDLENSAVAFVRALTELRGQAAHHERYRELFDRGDRMFEAKLRSIVRAGVEEGAFREVDPDRSAALLYALLTGVMARRASSGVDDWAEDVRAEIEAHLGIEQ